MTFDNIVFGKKLRALRISKSLSQTQLAKILFLDRSTLSYYEVGKSRPRYETLIRISSVFNVSVDNLLNIPSCEKFDYIGHFINLNATEQILLIEKLRSLIIE